MDSILKYYKFSIAFAVFSVIFGFFMWGPQAAFIIAVLGLIEISLSFDNSVVNTRILSNWDEVWRKRFLLWGMLIAVFGMRVVFPIAIVSVTTGIAPFYFPGLFGETLNITSIALSDPSRYADLLLSVHHEIAGFGAAFLMMVGLNFFFEEKHVYWLEAFETRLTNFGQIEAVAAAITLMTSLGVAAFMPEAQMHAFFVSAVWGVILYIITHGLGTLIGGEDDSEDSSSPVGGIVKASLAGFLYLEVIDASFSVDSVIGAFVLSNYLPIIALGLGVGAFFVRSMTIHLVEAGTLSEYRYLEHGAFYAILALAGIMFASGLGLHLPEWGTGLISVSFIIAAVVHSIIKNRQEV